MSLSGPANLVEKGDKTLSIDGVPIALTSVGVGRATGGFIQLCLLNFTATCPNVTAAEFINIVAELEKRGYLIKWREWANNPCTIKGKKSFKLSGKVNPKGMYILTIGDIQLSIRGSAMPYIWVREAAKV